MRQGVVTEAADEAGGVRIMGDRCAGCGEVSLGMSAVWLNCGAETLEVVPLATKGTLWTCTIVLHRPPRAYLGPEPFRPFGLGLIDLPTACA